MADRMPIDLDELVEHWTVLDDERVLVEAKHGATKLGFALLLKFYTRASILGRLAVTCQTGVRMSDAARHLTVLGDRTGSFVIEEELSDGRLVIRPEAEPPRSSRQGRPMTQDEFEAFMAQHGPNMLPGDDEG